MNNYISKTDFIQAYLLCPKYFWLKHYKPQVVAKILLSDFEKQIIEQGKEVEAWARKLYPQGVLIESRDLKAIEETKEVLEKGARHIFQATFIAEDLYAMVDILEWDEQNQHWIINEVKGTTSKEVKKEVHVQDACFQMIVLKRAGLLVGKVQLIELNKEFIKNGPISPRELLQYTDITEEVLELEPELELQIADAKRVRARVTEPPDCDCIYKSRANQCPTFNYCHPHVPDYSVHDICRIGNSLKKLIELVENNYLDIKDIPDDFELSPTQQPQVDVTKTGQILCDNVAIKKELEQIEYPIYFLDYESCPVAIPVFDGCRPFQQVPFQYSLHVLHQPNGQLEHKEFLHTQNSNPMADLAKSLREHIGDTGSVIVWHKSYEEGRNTELADYTPELTTFLHGINKRIVDLEDPFRKQLYVHKDFKGSSSIKAVLPVLVPDLSYIELTIQDGGSAANVWKQMIFEVKDEATKQIMASDLKAYCKLDTLAMVRIWEVLKRL